MVYTILYNTEEKAGSGKPIGYLAIEVQTGGVQERLISFFLTKLKQNPIMNVGNTHIWFWGISSRRMSIMPVTRKRSHSGKLIRSDSRGRIPLGPKATDKDFRVEYGEDGVISLIPVVFIPEREAWLYENESAIAQVRAGLADASEGRVRKVGSFAKHADTEIE